MKGKAYLAAVLAAILLFALTACGKGQPPAASDTSDPAAQQTEQQNDAETSGNEDSSTSGDEVSEDESVPTDAEEAPEEEPWKTALAEDLFE